MTIPEAAGERLPVRAARAAERVARSVVRIAVPDTDPTGRPTVAGAGTGFFLDDGQPLAESLITAAHVAAPCRRPLVMFGDGTIVQGTVIGSAKWPDLARISVPRVPAGVEPLAVRNVSQRPLSIGQRLLTVAFVWGEDLSAAPSSLCGLHGRVINDSAAAGILLDCHGGPGASGAPVVDRAGHAAALWIGSIWTPPSAGGAGHAIPFTSAVCELLAQLRAGDVVPGSLGLQTAFVDPATTLSRGDPTQCEEVTGIAPLGPAHLGGLQLADVLLGATNLVTGDQMFGPKRPPLAQFDCHCRLRNGHAVALDVRRRGEREQVSLSAQTQAQVATVMLEQRLALTLEEHSRGLQVGELAVEKFGLRLARDWVLPCALDLSRYQGLPRAWRDRLWRVPFLRGVGRKPILRQGDSIQGAMLLELAPLATRDRRGPPAKLVSERRVLDQHDLIAAMFWLAEASNSSPFFLGGLQVECRGGPPQVFFRQPTWAALVAELLRLEAAG